MGIAAFGMALGFHFIGSVWTLNTLTRDVSLLGGVGVLVTTDTTAGTITLDTSNLVSDLPGAGIAFNNSSGPITIYSPVAYATLNLTESDAAGAQVAYDININAPNGTWQVTTTATFPGTFIPGVVAGDGGQGNSAGTSWSVPANGVYAFNAHCTVVPSAYTVNDYESASIALSLNATTTTPSTGIVPPGGQSTLSLSVGSAGAGGPLTPSALAVNSIVHACATCLVQVGARLHLHARFDHGGSSLSPSAAFTCHLQVSRLV